MAVHHTSGIGVEIDTELDMATIVAEGQILTVKQCSPSTPHVYDVNDSNGRTLIASHSGGLEGGIGIAIAFLTGARKR